MTRFAIAALVAVTTLGACSAPQSGFTARMDTQSMMNIGGFSPAVIGARPDNDDMRYSTRGLIQ
ncbi:hypothetical protein FTO60_13445 [Octadecabacter sp. SW4]|uniref:hypothetical protein n=1 Tax=Octadecabacter sp. SW4 TaxID=2602067 RepID=UPI0011C1D236|nr:hypothetical protein [Octadecabacter sp. SW4]QEE36631.1 hypothetical protein FTO60_13445 [Octadecabacter sp. SW4]|tara:strand:- start:318 stop:509 length:192 start_codon:yes stop_codon:yes gene_type:complete